MTNREMSHLGDVPQKNAHETRRALFLGVTVFVAGLVFALLIGEVMTRVFFRHSMDFDMEMWKYASKVKMLDDSSTSVYGHRPDTRAFLMGVPVRTNSHGLRGDETPPEKPANTYRIVAVGDSITMGWGVSHEDTYPEQLERLLNENPPKGFPANVNYEVLNLGVGNYNTVQEVERLRELGLRFDPDLILLGYFINDAEPVPRPRTGFLIENSYLYAFIVSRLRLINVANDKPRQYQNYYLDLYRDGQPGWEATRKSLSELAEIARENTIPAFMFIIPELHDLSANYPFADIHDRLLKASMDSGLPAVDLLPMFRGKSPETSLWVSPTDAHHNAEAQRIIARGIYNALDQGLVQP